MSWWTCLPQSCADSQAVFVTGNANKLREVKAILDAGGAGIEVTNQAVDGEKSKMRAFKRSES